jgi:hypothetical protein
VVAAGEGVEAAGPQAVRRARRREGEKERRREGEKARRREEENRERAAILDPGFSGGRGRARAPALPGELAVLQEGVAAAPGRGRKRGARSVRISFSKVVRLRRLIPSSY